MESSQDVKDQISDFIDSVFDSKYKQEESGLFSIFTSMFTYDKSNKHLFEELKAELRLSGPKVEITSKLEVDVDFSKLSQSELEMILETLTNVNKEDMNMFYPHLILSILQNNSEEINKSLFEKLPKYIETCLSRQESECISDYELLKFDVYKSYILDMEQKINSKYNVQLRRTEQPKEELKEELKIEEPKSD